MKTILISGDPLHEAFGPVKLKDHHLPIVVVDDAPEPEDLFEINGIKYKERPQPNKSNGRLSKMALMAMMFSEVSMYGSSRKSERARPPVNIITEFEKIQNKESNLSRNDREWVEYQFKQMYIPI